MENIKGQMVSNNYTGIQYLVSEINHDGVEWVVTLELKNKSRFKINSYDFHKSYTTK